MNLKSCQLCSLYKNNCNKVSLPIVCGTTPSVMFLGSSPTTNDSKDGVPFSLHTSDRVSMLHREILELMCVENSHIAMNAVQCVVGNEASDNFNSFRPSIKQINTCSVWVKKVLQSYRVRIIVLYGGVPVKQILNFDELEPYIGKFFEASSFDNTKCFVTHNLSNDVSIGIFKKHIKLISRFLHT